MHILTRNLSLKLDTVADHTLHIGNWDYPNIFKYIMPASPLVSPSISQGCHDLCFFLLYVYCEPLPP